MDYFHVQHEHRTDSLVATTLVRDIETRYRVAFFDRSALKNDQVSDYIVNPIKKVLSVRFSNGSGT